MGDVVTVVAVSVVEVTLRNVSDCERCMSMVSCVSPSLLVALLRPSEDDGVTREYDSRSLLR